MLWYLCLDSNLYHIYHTLIWHYDQQIGLLLPQHFWLKSTPPCPPLPYQHSCFPMGICSVQPGRTVILKKLLSLSSPAALQTCRWGIRDATTTSRARSVLLWRWVCLGAIIRGTTHLIPAVDRQLESVFAGGPKWLWNAQRIILEKHICRSHNLVQQPMW